MRGLIIVGWNLYGSVKSEKERTIKREGFSHEKDREKGAGSHHVGDNLVGLFF